MSNRVAITDDVPKEIIRLSVRVREQSERLDIILERNLRHWLEECSRILKPYNSQLSAEMDKLVESVYAYNKEAQSKFEKLADFLNKYGTDTQENLEQFATDVKSTTSGIDSI